MRLAYDDRAEDRRPAVAPDLRRRPRHYLRLGGSGLLATRIRGVQEHRRFCRLHATSAATRKCAATTTCSSSDRTRVYANAELRFPLIEAALTPIGVVGGVRGVFFANIGGGWFNESTVGPIRCDDAGGYKFATHEQPSRAHP